MRAKSFVVLAGVLAAVSGFTASAKAEAPASAVKAANEYQGFQAGDIMLRVRGLGVLPNVSTNNVAPNSVGGTVDASTSMVPEFDATYFFTPNIAVEAIAATTRHHMRLKGSSLGASTDLGKVQLLPPTLTAQWHFMPKSRVSPYLGAGINYTWFFGTSGNPLGSSVHYENGFGEVLQAGADIHIDGNWYANIDVKQVFLSTVANVGGSQALASVNLNPTLVGVGVGYKF